MNPARKYPFNLPWAAIALGVVFYGALSGCMADHAARSDGVTCLFELLLSAAFAVLAIIMMTRRLLFPRVLELAEDAVLFPHGFPWTRVTRLPYADIIRVTERWDSFRNSFWLVLAGGTYEIIASHFPDMKSYLAVRDLIFSRAFTGMTRHDRRDASPPRTWQELPEPVLRWVEPDIWPRYRTHLVVSQSLWRRLAQTLRFFAACFGIVISPWLLMHLLCLPTIPAADFLCLALPVTLFFTSLHWLRVTYPATSSTISNREKGITRCFGKQTWNSTYRDCSGWAVIEKQFEGSHLQVLLLHGRTRIFAFALPDTDTRDRLVQILRDRQIPESPNLKPPWESSA